MSESKSQFDDPTRGPVWSVRFVISLLLIVAGIAWVLFYYLQVRPDPAVLDARPGNPAFMAELKDWNYAIGLGLPVLGLVLAAHPSTPLGRGRGVVTGMLGCFLFGLLWICTFYVFSNDLASVPVLNDLGNYNLMVGIVFMGVGFAYATRWE